MNFSFLPNKIKEQIKQVVADELPVSLARSNTSIDGNTGESYVLGYKDKIVVFSRKLGENNYTCIAGDLGDVGNVALRKEGASAFLDTEIRGSKYSLKFSSFEEKSLAPIVEQWQQVNAGGNYAQSSSSSSQTEQIAGQPAAENQKRQLGQISLMEGLAVALMFVASVDGEVAQEEDQYLLHVFSNDKQLLRKSLAYYNSHSFDQLLSAISGMNREQKLCYVANMMEIGMTDGVLHRNEMKIIRQFCDYMKVTQEEYDTIKQVLLIKNQLSVM